MIGKPRREDLCLIFEPAKSAGMNDPVAIALKFVSEGMREFRVAAAAAALHRESKMGERARQR